jgi:hypothetical protein
MPHRTLFSASTVFLIVTLASPIQAQQVDLANVEGSPELGVIHTGDPVVIDFNWNNNGPDTITGWRNGFRFWMIGDGTRSVVTIDSLLFYEQAEAAGMNMTRLIRTFGPGDGTGVDTIGTMATSFEGGMLPWFDDVICRFTVAFDSSTAGDVFCIDSSWFHPQDGWVWVNHEFEEFPPAWDGPHCFDIVYYCCRGLRGNVDGDPDDKSNIVDLVYLVAYKFGYGPDPECWEEANIDGDPSGTVGIDDITYLVAYLFGGGPPPGPCL